MWHSVWSPVHLSIIQECETQREWVWKGNLLHVGVAVAWNCEAMRTGPYWEARCWSDLLLLWFSWSFHPTKVWSAQEPTATTLPMWLDFRNSATVALIRQNTSQGKSPPPGIFSVFSFSLLSQCVIMTVSPQGTPSCLEKVGEARRVTAEIIGMHVH